jgi:putative ABC transport system permease protein
MLAQAGLLGLGSAVAGIAIAIMVVAATLPVSSQVVGRDIAPLRVAPLDLAGLLLLGTFAAVAAAYVPARQAARQDAIAALAGRRGTTRTRRGWPVAGVALMAAGAGVAVVLGHRTGGEWLVVVGTFALVAGAIMVTPAVVGGVGRLGGRLPLSLRLAARDTSRHRSRTTPAVAAIMGVVTGITALAIGSASDFEQNRQDYRPQAAPGTMLVALGDTTPSSIDALSDRIRAEVPGSRPAALWQVPSYPVGGKARGAVVLDPACRTPSPLECQARPDIPGVHMFSMHVDGMVVANPQTVARFASKAALTPAQRDVLSAGGVLVPYKSALNRDGTVEVATFTRRVRASGSEEVRDVHRQRLPAAILPGTVHGAEYTYLADIVATPATAKRLGLDAVADQIVVEPPAARPISHEQEERVAEIARGLSGGSSVYVERGFVETYTVQFLGIAILGGLFVLVGTATATALALDDARPDVVTLAAVGASPRTRRRMAMAQAAVISLLGVVFGVVVGAAPGLAVTWPLTAGLDGRTSPIIDIPWTLLGLVAIGVPALAILGAGLLTTSKVPMIRRAE